MPWFWRSRSVPRARAAPSCSRWFRPVLECLEDRLVLSTFLVSNTNDSGMGSLRQAILDANAAVGSTNLIQFAILGTGVHTIAPLSSLPTVTNPVVIDGYSQTGASANTLAVGDNAVLKIELDGASAGTGTAGLTLAAGGSTVRGLVINRFGGDGIDVNGSGPANDTIAGNFIGTNASGSGALGNGHFGVLLNAGSNTVGGTTPGDRNLLSGNSSSGIRVFDGGNTVQGNYIGTDATGNGGLGNTGGVNDGAVTVQHDGNAILDNVISGNTGVGILFYYATGGVSAPVGSVVSGNLIGLGADGSTSLGNGNYGIYLALDSRKVTIGGATAADGNVISENGGFDIISDSQASGALIENNLIGTDATGMLGRGNNARGIYDTAPDDVIRGNLLADDLVGIDLVFAAATGNTVVGNTIGLNAAGSILANGIGIEVQSASGNTIGGTTAADRNLISGNTNYGYGNYGILMDQGAANNIIIGNFIGTDATGALARPNGTGIEILSAATNNTIGGTGAGAGNVISGNSGDGIRIGDAGTSGNAVEGNLIGTNAAGNGILANGGDGVHITAGATNNTIGGLTTTPGTGAGNVISGNSTYGIEIDTSTSTGNVVEGNLVGTDSTGKLALGNTASGISVAASSNLIGGTSSQARNVIAGSSSADGITVTGNNNVVEGNYVGVDITGNTPLGNSTGLVASGTGNQIGGLTSTPGTGAGNVISGNAGVGLYLSSGINDQAEGNLIGLGADGTTAVGNGGYAIYVVGATNNTIGGTAAGAGNVISGNATVGVFDTGAGTTIAGNFVGTDVTGTLARGNGFTGAGESGIFASGGNEIILGNLISGNTGIGLTIDADNVQVQGNSIGTRLDGLAALPNQESGIYVLSANNTIGGTTAAARNIISGNAQGGVAFATTAASGNVVEGNYIGVGRDGITAVPNTRSAGSFGDGVELINGAANNTIGGTAAGAGNVISGNAVNGVEIDGTGTTNNTVEGNLIGTDASGTVKLANAADGVHLDQGTASNTIGGTMAAARNVISGNGANGIHILGVGTTSNVIAGNYVGTDENGTAALGNAISGIYLDVAGGTNTIGGTAAGAGNVISGNVADGISDLAGNLLVQGNLIGTDKNGTTALGNRAHGIGISNAGGVTVGGTTTAARNVISANAQGGIQIAGDLDGTGNLVEGNYVGTDVTGNAALGNGFAGVQIFNDRNNTIGGSAAGAGNLISGNAGFAGVYINSTSTIGAINNLVEGNFIGTNATATAALGNQGAGVRLDSSLGGINKNNTIGGITTTAGTGAGNVISGNAGNGVELDNTGTTNNTVEGNLVGTDASGTAKLGNAQDGVVIQSGASNNTVGGTDPGARNVISGNDTTGTGFFGVYLKDSGTDGNVVAGNFIGTDITGTAALGNIDGGVLIEFGATNNTIGGTAAGARNLISGNQQGDGVGVADASGNMIVGNFIGTDVSGTVALGNQGGGAASGGNGVLFEDVSNSLIADNLISGNDGTGIFFLSSVTGVSGNVIQGNKIGTDVTGLHALPNTGAQGYGIRFFDARVHDNTIGGTTAGAGNLISGNAVSGILIAGPSNLVEGNKIGTDVNGSAALGNQTSGILIERAANNVIGGTSVGAGNLVSGNNAVGVEISEASGTVVQGNKIGSDGTGTQAVPNHLFGGVLIQAGSTNNTIGGTAAGAGNLISGNAGNGVEIDNTGTTNNTVEGNLIGTDASGTAKLGNTLNGVLLETNATNNTIGGTDPRADNVISGNDGEGIDITGSGTTGNTILGNYIGTNLAGTAMLSNVNGVVITDASNNIIGGTTAAARNVISGNSSIGVNVLGTTSTGNVIQGNYIGTDASGSLALPNVYGVQFGGTTFGNTVGGSLAGAGNVISGNTVYGVVYVNTGTAGNPTQGNIIGLAADGDTPLGNGFAGVIVSGANNNTIGGRAAGAGNVISANPDGILVVGGSGTVIQGNYLGTDVSGTQDRGNTDGVEVDFSGLGTLIGGTGAGAGNVISGNNFGIVVQDAGTSGTLIQGNLIGTDKNGTAALANTQDGLLIRNGATGNTIGGITAGARNVIAGNTGAGVELDTKSNIVEGNYIGTDITGNAALSNGNGVVIQGDDNTIGGTVAAARNVISGNRATGIQINGSTGNTVAGNYIGTDAAGAAAIGNDVGILVDFDAAAANNTIGGTTAGAGNVISGNHQYGIRILGTGSMGNAVAGNYIGTDKTGAAALGNGIDGVQLDPGADNNTIGGTAAGAGNLISGNGRDGVRIVASGNVVQGNHVGTNAPGNAVLANGEVGVWVVAGSGNLVGGSATGAENVVVGGGYGLDFSGSDNVAEGNLIGTDATGTSRLGSFTYDAVLLDDATSGTASGNRIGTNADGVNDAAEANTIAGGGLAGVDLAGPNVHDNVVAGNRVGVSRSGTAILGGNTVGVLIRQGGHDNTIGGTTAAARNVISGNIGDGIDITGNGTTGNLVASNFIGTDQSGSHAFANTQDGILIENGASNNIIGEIGSGNTIAFNGGAGVALASGTGNAISANAIFATAHLGIDLGKDGVTPNDANPRPSANDGQTFPVLASASSDSVTGTLASTPNSSFRVEIFSSPASDPSGFGQGQVFLGSTTATTDASGQASFSLDNTPITDSQFLTATATNLATNDTSEFSQAFFVSFRAPDPPPSNTSEGEGTSPAMTAMPMSSSADPTTNTTVAEAIVLARAAVMTVLPPSLTSLSPVSLPSLNLDLLSTAVALLAETAESVATVPAQRDAESAKDSSGDTSPAEVGRSASVFGLPLDAVRQGAVNPVNAVNSNLPANLSVVDAALRRSNGTPPGGGGTAEGEETQSAKAAQLFSSTLEGDDSVVQIETLLQQGSLPEQTVAISAGTKAASRTISYAEETAETVAPAPKPSLLGWLSVPAGLVVVGLGFWRRSRARRKGHIDRSAPLVPTAVVGEQKT